MIRSLMWVPEVVPAPVKHPLLKFILVLIAELLFIYFRLETTLSLLNVGLFLDIVQQHLQAHLWSGWLEFRELISQIQLEDGAHHWFCEIIDNPTNFRHRPLEHLQVWVQFIIYRLLFVLFYLKVCALI